MNPWPNAPVYPARWVLEDPSRRPYSSAARFSHQVVNGVQLRDPPLECHPTGTDDLEAIAIGSWLAGVSRERAVPTVERYELLDVSRQAHRCPSP